MNKCDASTYFANNNICLHTAGGNFRNYTGLCLDTLEFAGTLITVCGAMFLIGLCAGAVCGCCCCIYHHDETKSNQIKSIEEQEFIRVDAPSVMSPQTRDSPIISS